MPCRAVQVQSEGPATATSPLRAAWHSRPSRRRFSTDAMVAREGERDAPRAPAPPSADAGPAGAAGSSGAHASGWAPAFAGARAPWERPPGAPENTRWRAWGGRGRDRPRSDAGWSRKDRRAARKHARDDRRYFDYDRTDAPPGSSAAPAFVPPYERDARLAPPYGAPEDAAHGAPRPHLPYGDAEAHERKPRVRSRWDVGPRDAAPVPGPPPPPPPLPPAVEPRAAPAAVKHEDAEAMDIDAAPAQPPKSAEASLHAAPTSRDDRAGQTEGEAPMDVVHEAPAAPAAPPLPPAPPARPAPAEPAESKEPAEAAEPKEAKASEREAPRTQSAMEGVPPAPLHRPHAPPDVRPPLPLQDESKPLAPPQAPQEAAAPVSGEDEAMREAKADEAMREAEPREGETVRETVPSEGKPMRTPAADEAMRSAPGKDEAVHAPAPSEGEAVRASAADEAMPPAEDRLRPLQASAPAEPVAGGVTPAAALAAGAPAASAAPVAGGATPAATAPVASEATPAAAAPVASGATPSTSASAAPLSRSLRPIGMLDEEMMEQAILATERTLHAAERAAGGAASPEAARRPSTPATPLASSVTAPDAPRPVEHALATAKEPADVEATAQTVLAMAERLVAAHPLTDTHVARVLEANRGVARSLTAPAVLAYTRAPEASSHVARAVLERDAQERHAARQAKTAALRAEYRRLHTAWVAYCAHLDRVYERREAQRRAPAAGAHDDELASSAPAALATPLPSRTSRRGAGGFGDAVRSEAEFLEILASLESAEMQDPVARAARTAASVPDMDVRVPGDAALVDGDNGFVADFGRFYFSSFDPDVWSAEERAAFTKRYALYPKQFGRIARGLPHKTMQQCVVYYYLHKHLPGYDFKALSTKSRERKRKARRPKKAKGSALMADIAAGSRKEHDADDADDAKPRADDDRPKTGAKRARPPKKAPTPGADDAQAPADAQADAERARDLAAAEALEALAGLAAPPPAPKKKAARRPKREDDGEPRSRSRGPHWSMTERAEFLRLLALHGKDWAALATAFPAKTAAQTRNFFARHASESSHFQAAAALALENATRPYAERSAAAVAFVNEWYASLADDVQASIEGWPADPASFAEPLPAAGAAARDDDETDEEAAAEPAAAPPAPYAAQGGSGPPPPGTGSGAAPPAPPPAAAAPVARAAPEPWGYAYVPPARPMAYREGYERYAMYAYPDRYRHEYAAAPYRDERAYAPAYAPDALYAERRSDAPPDAAAYERARTASPEHARRDAYARAEYAPVRPDAYADGVPPARRGFLPPGPSLGYFPPRAERGWRGA